MFEIFFPKICIECSKVLGGNQNIICVKCLSKIPFAKQYHKSKIKIKALLYGRVNYKYIYTFMYMIGNNSTKNIIYNFKYYKRLDIGIFFSKLMAEELSKTNFQECDIIVPVPIHNKKLRNRGFNQSIVIAKYISQQLQIPICKNNLIRKKFNKVQANIKDKKQRFENVKNVFEVINKKLFQNKHILLVDDIITSGATIEACTIELNKSKNISISIVSMALAN